MLSASGIRNACPKCRALAPRSLSQSLIPSSTTAQWRSTAVGRRLVGNPSHRIGARRISTFPALRQQNEGAATAESPTPSSSDIERVVREAKQRFRDTLPKDYLNEEEYALYERLYGPPLRETTPEDVGIPMHADMGQEEVRVEGEGTVLKELDGGEFEEINYELAQVQLEKGMDPDGPEAEVIAAAVAGEISPQELVERAPTYADAVARSEREHEVMQRLMGDFETARQKQKAQDDAAEENEADSLLVGEEDAWPEESVFRQGRDDEAEEFDEPSTSAETKRFHPYTLEGRFHGTPIEIPLPHEKLVAPIRALLSRTHPRHVQLAAESAFGGAGLPTSPTTPPNRRNGHMGGVGLAPSQKHMTEIQADAFISSYIPPAYATSASILREVRKRMGSGWLQSRLKEGKAGGPSVLDVGMGGAGLVAWEEIVNAEWEVLKEKGEVRGVHPPGKKTAVIGSERLWSRLKTFLHNTTFLPRLPDYGHSGETRQGEHIDGGGQQQPRKVYDVIIASHLLLREKQDHYRQAILNNLWSLLNKNGGILIVVEKAHPRGFEAVAHVRQTLLDRYLLPQSDEPYVPPEDFNPAYDRVREPGHIIGPCTNHGTCPLYKSQGKAVGRKDYCHFSQRFVRPQFYNEVLGSRSNQGEVEFSYVALQRGVSRSHAAHGAEATLKAFKGYETSDEKPDMLSLPRMIRQPLKRKGHVTLDVCTPEGKTERWTVPKSYSNLAYHDARKSRWGDLWALGAKTRVPRSARAGVAQTELDLKRPGDAAEASTRDAEGGKPRKVAEGRRAMAEQSTRKSRKKKEKDMLQQMFDEERKAEEEEYRDFKEDVERELEEAEEEDEKSQGRRRG